MRGGGKPPISLGTLRGTLGAGLGSIRRVTPTPTGMKETEPAKCGSIVIG